MGYNGIQCLNLTAWYDTWICPKTADTLDAMAISQWDDDEPLDLGAPHFEKQTRVESKSLKFLKNQVVKLYPIISKYIPMISPCYWLRKPWNMLTKNGEKPKMLTAL